MVVTQPAITDNVAWSPVVEAEGLTRAFGGRRAVDDVSFTLAEHECLAIFGVHVIPHELLAAGLTVVCSHVVLPVV